MPSAIVLDAMSPAVGAVMRMACQLYLPSVLVGFGLGMLLPTLPIVARSFDVPPEVAAQGITAMLIGRAATQFPAGYVVDRFGCRAAMILGPLLLAGGVLITALTPWFGPILLGQAMVGSGEGFWSLGREIAAVEQIRADRRARLMGIFFGLSAAGNTLGPVVGGWITDSVGYRAVFVLSSLFALIVLAIGLTYHDPPTRVRRAPTAKSALRPFQAIAPGYLFTFKVLMFASFCVQIRNTSVQSLLPVYTVSWLGYSASDVGYLFGVAGLVQLAMILPAGFISDKIGRKAAVVPASAIVAVAFFGFWLSQGMFGLTLSAVLLGFAQGLSVGAMTSFTYDMVSPEARGSVQAFRRSIAELGSFSGPVIGGLIASLTYPGLAFLAFAPLHLMMALAMLFFARETLGVNLMREARRVAAEKAALEEAAAQRTG